MGCLSESIKSFANRMSLSSHPEESGIRTEGYHGEICGTDFSGSKHRLRLCTRVNHAPRFESIEKAVAEQLHPSWR